MLKFTCEVIDGVVFTRIHENEPFRGGQRNKPPIYLRDTYNYHETLTVFLSLCLYTSPMSMLDYCSHDPHECA